MNRLEAFQAMVAGEKVCHPKSKVKFFYSVKNHYSIYEYGGMFGHCKFFGDFILRDGWKIYEEPKSKVKLYKYRIIYDGRYLDTEEYFKDDNDLLNLYYGDHNCKIIKRLDETMIEVEE